MLVIKYVYSAHAAGSWFPASIRIVQIWLYICPIVFFFFHKVPVTTATCVTSRNVAVLTAVVRHSCFCCHLFVSAKTLLRRWEEMLLSRRRIALTSALDWLVAEKYAMWLILWRILINFKKVKYCGNVEITAFGSLTFLGGVLCFVDRESYYSLRKYPTLRTILFHIQWYLG